MEGDFSLNALFSRPGVTRVLLQQGRVLLPSDWNEQVAVSTGQLRELALDLIGPHAGPRGNAGFKITVDPAKPNLLRIGKGRYWVEGILVENDKDRGITEQPYYSASDLKLDGNILVYLEVREQHISAVQDPSIREIALGGPDTATRAVVVWQVRAIEWGPVPAATEAWQQLKARLARKTMPKLIAEAKLDRDDEACIISPDSRYTGPENQLYRVEIHSAATAQAPAKFKWSRDNGSISFGASKIEGRTATVLSLGRDRRTSLSVGDYVEAGNDVTRFNDEVRPLVPVKKIDTSTLEVTLDADPGLTTDPKDKRHPFLRRWDSQLIDVPKNGVPVTLEKGIEVTFPEKDADYRPGDYWLIPARTISGDVIWPRDDQDKPLAVEPHGPTRAHAPLLHRGATGGLKDLRWELDPQPHLKPAP